MTPGTIVGGRYRIVSQLGRGGMGEVYRAEDLKLEQTVALKFLPGSVRHDGAAQARLHREIRTARGIAHPNVCRVFDLGDADDRVFLSMEYIEGEDFEQTARCRSSDRTGHRSMPCSRPEQATPFGTRGLPSSARRRSDSGGACGGRNAVARKGGRDSERGQLVDTQVGATSRSDAS